MKRQKSHLGNLSTGIWASATSGSGALYINRKKHSGLNGFTHIRVKLKRSATNPACLSGVCVCVYFKGAAFYPLSFRAAHMGLCLFAATCPQLTQRVSMRLPAVTRGKHSCLSFRPQKKPPPPQKLLTMMSFVS